MNYKSRYNKTTSIQHMNFVYGFVQLERERTHSTQSHIFETIYLLLYLQFEKHLAFNTWIRALGIGTRYHFSCLVNTLLRMWYLLHGYELSHEHEFHTNWLPSRIFFPSFWRASIIFWLIYTTCKLKYRLDRTLLLKNWTNFDSHYFVKQT